MSAAVSLPVPRPARQPLRRLGGAGLLVAVGYMDPGNWATDIAAGSSYRYALLSVVVAAGVLGLLLQNLAARVAVATGQDLAQLSARHLPAPLAQAAWLAGEAAILATAPGRAGGRCHRLAAPVRPGFRRRAGRHRPDHAGGDGLVAGAAGRA
jgi:Mn2+/Fe2+ NRAMP family transporter